MPMRLEGLPPDLAGNFPKRIPRGLVGEKIGGKRVLGADGFACPVGTNRPLTRDHLGIAIAAGDFVFAHPIPIAGRISAPDAPFAAVEMEASANGYASVGWSLVSTSFKLRTP
jgi:hypothetical protein